MGKSGNPTPEKKVSVNVNPRAYVDIAVVRTIDIAVAKFLIMLSYLDESENGPSNYYINIPITVMFLKGIILTSLSLSCFLNVLY